LNLGRYLDMYKKIANQNHEEAGRFSTRSVSRHGLKPGRRLNKRLVNRIAKREESRLAFKDS